MQARVAWLVWSLAIVGAAAIVSRLPVGPASVEPVPLVTPTPTLPEIPAELVGTWERRDAYLIVGPSGAARFRWLTSWCSDGVPEPCDHQVGDSLLVGAHAEIGLIGPDPRDPSMTVVGRIFSVTPAGLFVVGPVRIVRLADDLIELRQEPHRIELCRPPRELNLCDTLMRVRPNYL
jgi:hypothetical protein